MCWVAVNLTRAENDNLALGVCWPFLLDGNSRPANLSIPKTLWLVLQVGMAPMELLVNHTYRRKMGNFQVRNRLNASQVSPTFA